MPAEPAPYSAHSPEDYLRTRVDFKTEAYRKKGERYRWGYLFMASVAAASAATVPVLINLPGVPTIYPTLLSLLVTILASLEGLFHMREHWKNYDLMKSFLRQEACLFQAGAGAYRGKELRDAFVLLVERVEEEVAKERAQTIQMRTARSTETEHQEPKRDSKTTRGSAAKSPADVEPGAAPDRGGTSASQGS